MATVITKTGKTRPVCEYCGRLGRAIAKRPEDVHFGDLADGWWVSPYPRTFVHADGTTGTTFCCPDCDARLAAGEGLVSRHAAGEVS